MFFISRGHRFAYNLLQRYSRLTLGAASIGIVFALALCWRFTFYALAQTAIEREEKKLTMLCERHQKLLQMKINRNTLEKSVAQLMTHSSFNYLQKRSVADCCSAILGSLVKPPIKLQTYSLQKNKDKQWYQTAHLELTMQAPFAALQIFFDAIKKSDLGLQCDSFTLTQVNENLFQCQATIRFIAVNNLAMKKETLQLEQAEGLGG